MAVKTGRVRLTIKTPKGAPGTVKMTGNKTTRVIGKAAAGTSSTSTIAVGPGQYALKPQIVTAAGRVYVPAKTTIKVKVKAGRTTKATVAYRLARAAKDIRVLKLEQTRIQLAWKAPSKATTQLRLIKGNTPTKSVTKGKLVKAGKTGVRVSGLAAGTAYSFSLFTKVKSRWLPPVTITASTTSAGNTNVPAFVTTPSTVIVPTSDTRKVIAANGVVTAAVPAGTVPTVGQVMVFPVSTSLPGGYVGKIASVSTDGRSVTLAAASVSEAFSAYKIDIPEFTGDNVELQPAASAGSAKRLEEAQSQRDYGRDGFVKSARPTSKLADCLGGSYESKISINAPKIKPSGSFSFSLDTLNILGASVPTGAEISAKVQFATTQTMNVDSEAAINCGIQFKPVMKTFATSPLPLSLLFTPVAQISVTGEIKFQNVGVTVTSGVWAKASLGVSKGSTVEGGLIHEVQPEPGTKDGITGAVKLTLGGELIVGPGAGSAVSGAIAGLSGQLNIVDGSFGTAFPLGDPRFGKCFKTTVGMSYDIGLTAKAWLKNWEISSKLPVVSGSLDYGGPWYVPDGCNTMSNPGEDVIGDGITKISEEIGGSSEQWGKSDAFEAGVPSWILSTGRVSDISGVADDFASTDLGLPGDAQLTNLVGGLETHDAAFYSAMLTPEGDMLHVKYLFASEEYPEYVGSAYNDVMAVFVNGSNCALIDGEPVAVNTINADENSASYIANDGTKPTSMNGYTIPLQCDVSVTPGIPVKVTVAVADTSDGVYDTAVGLLDRGIWSD